MVVGFNRETARHLARISENDRRSPRVKVQRPPKRPVENFPTIVAKAPSGGIAAGSSENCQVQSVDSNGGLSDAGWTESCVNIWSTAVAADATIVATVENATGLYVVIAEDCT